MIEYLGTDNLVATMRSHKICIVVPTYNNEGSVGQVISNILEYSSDIIVVNDGSTDSTLEILRTFSSSIHLVSYERNKGKGAALKRGFREALAQGYEYAITIDSDGQHYPSEIPAFVKAIVENPGAIIIGQRDLSAVDINGKSAFANKFSNFWFAVQTGRKLNDTQTGYRAYPLKSLHGLSFLTSRYEAELELLVFAAWRGVKIVSMPISVYYPPQSERVSHFKPALDFTRISILNTILCFAAIVYGAPSILCHKIASRRFFQNEFRPFTRKGQEKRAVSVTLGRIGRSLYALSHFLFWSVFVFKPFVYINFKIRKPDDATRLKLHRKLHWMSSFFSRIFPGGRARIENTVNEDFSKPAVIICNHQSHLDLPVIMAAHPKLVFLTNDWVWNNCFFGEIVRQAEYLPVSAGMDVIIPHLSRLRDRGYSIVVFPEGTRSADCKIERFHQGAFLLARELNMDILPMVLHGAGHYLAKHDSLVRKNPQTLRVLRRVALGELGDMPLRKQASHFRKVISDEYNCMVQEIETPGYWRSFVTYKYAYRGWRVTHRAKSELRQLDKIGDELTGIGSSVCFINAGVGVLPLVCALANKNIEVVSYVEDYEDFIIASETPDLPDNLRIIHSVWDDDYERISSYGKIFVTSALMKTRFKSYNPILLHVK